MEAMWAERDRERDLDVDERDHSKQEKIADIAPPPLPHFYT